MPGAGVVIDGNAPDGTPEAIYVEGAPGFRTLAVQWHPEWNAGNDPVSRPLFEAFGAAVNHERDDWLAAPGDNPGQGLGRGAPERPRGLTRGRRMGHRIRASLGDAASIAADGAITRAFLRPPVRQARCGPRIHRLGARPF
jgi:hypothetical protein